MIYKVTLKENKVSMTTLKDEITEVDLINSLNKKTIIRFENESDSKIKRLSSNSETSEKFKTVWYSAIEKKMTLITPVIGKEICILVTLINLKK